jgi:HlyD family secretion protein
VKKRIIIVIFVAVLLGVGALVYFGQRSVRLRALYYSGTIEATTSELAFQVSGRVVEVLVDEGEAVEKDQLLAELERSEFEARSEQAKANLEASIKNLERLELVLEISQSTLPAEVARAEASVEALRAGLDELEAGNRAQDIEQARLAYLSAKVTMEDAERDKKRHDRLFREKIISETQRDAAALRYETTSKEYERAKEKYDLIKEGFRKETIQTARARLAEGEAVLNQARSNLKKIDAAKGDVEVARAQVQAARAAVHLAETQLRYTQLKAPFKGIITSRNVEPGEVVVPGREILSLADLSSVDLKIFVDETEIGKVKPGQKVEVKVDTFPDKAYWGRVAYISPEGEFTPKIIQTRKERVKLVYLVKVSVPNPNLELKSGMPADAWLR